MDKRPLFSAAVSFSLGAVMAVSESLTLRIIFIIILVFLFLSLLKRKRAMCLIFLAVFLLGLLRGGTHLLVRNEAKLIAKGLSYEEQVFYGKAEKAEEKNNTYAYYLKDTYFLSEYTPGNGAEILQSACPLW